MNERVHPVEAVAVLRFRAHLSGRLGVELTPAEAAWLWSKLPPLRAGHDAPELGRFFQTLFGTCTKCGTILLLLLSATGEAKCFDCWQAERSQG